MKKEQLYQNSHKKAGFLVHISFESDPWLRFGKLQSDLDDFYFKCTNKSDTAGTEIFKRLQNGKNIETSRTIDR